MMMSLFFMENSMILFNIFLSFFLTDDRDFHESIHFSSFSIRYSTKVSVKICANP